jgi:hypothetical protein
MAGLHEVIMSATAEVKPKLWTPEILADYLSVPVGWIYKRTRTKGAPERIPHMREFISSEFMLYL